MERFHVESRIEAGKIVYVVCGDDSKHTTYLAAAERCDELNAMEGGTV